MKAEDLIALATGHGIDLKAVAGGASNLDGVAKLRPRTKAERLAGIPAVVETATGTQTRVSHAPQWSHAELAMALGGLPRMPTLAALYSFARDDANYGELLRGLMLTAMRVCRDDAWPMRVGRTDPPYAYVTSLSGLVLDADRHSRFFNAAPSLYPLYMDVTEEVWGARLAGKYSRLRDRYQAWLDSARYHINRRLVDTARGMA